MERSPSSSSLYSTATVEGEEDDGKSESHVRARLRALDGALQVCSSHPVDIALLRCWAVQAYIYICLGRTPYVRRTYVRRRYVRRLRSRRSCGYGRPQPKAAAVEDTSLGVALLRCASALHAVLSAAWQLAALKQL